MAKRNFKDGNGVVLAHRHKNSNGEKGGWIANTAVVADTVYVGKDARVYGNAVVSGNARVLGNASVFDDAVVSGNARVYGNAVVSGNASVSGNANVFDDAVVSGNASVSGNAIVFDNAIVSGNAIVLGDAVVSGNASVFGNVRVLGDAVVSGNASVSGNDYLTIGPIGSVGRVATVTLRPVPNIRTGCFAGTIEAFREVVRETHGDNQHARDYLVMADFVDALVKLRQGVDQEDSED
jgi:carbonic anhydrase/acetyltransferase-like protein (isoleucine patch superfamily)